MTTQIAITKHQRNFLQIARRNAAEMHRLAKNGKISRSQAAQIIGLYGKPLTDRLARIERYGVRLPEITEDRKKWAWADSPLDEPRPVPDELVHDGCRRLAATIVLGAIREIKAGRNLRENIEFLWSDRAAIFLDTLDIDRDALMERLEKMGVLE